VADLNQDNAPDIALVENPTGSTMTVKVLLNKNDLSGTFNTPTVDYSVKGSNAEALAVGDFNADNAPDLALESFGTTPQGEFDNQVTVLMNKADNSGGLIVGNAYATDPDPKAGGIVSVATGDLNHDGKDDLVGCNSIGGTVAVLISNGDGSFAAPKLYSTGGFPWAAVTGDFNFNGDHADDIVTVSRQDKHNVQILTNLGDGTFASQDGFAVGAGPTQIVKGDFNGDNKPDLVTANQYANNITILLNLTADKISGTS